MSETNGDSVITSGAAKIRIQLSIQMTPELVERFHRVVEEYGMTEAGFVRLMLVEQLCVYERRIDLSRPTSPHGGGIG